MRKSTISLLFTYALICVGLVFLFLILCLNVSAKTVYVDVSNTGMEDGSQANPYNTIQEGIDNADSGDTVYVLSGTYNENVMVNKKIDLTGENKDTTLIDGGGSGDVVNVSSDWVNITGFTITGSGGVWAAGIELASVQNCNISFNIISNNYNGIRLFSASGNKIVGNIVSTNTMIGIYLDCTTQDNISGNIMMGDGIVIYGTLVEHCNTHFIDASNTVDGKPVCYWKNRTDGAVPKGSGQVILANCSNVNVRKQENNNGSMGILLIFSSYNNICYNNASSNTLHGIGCFASSNNKIVGNTLSLNNYHGIFLSSSNTNLVIGNNISNNQFGIFTYSSSIDNKIYHNNFVDNSNQANDPFVNLWNDSYPSGGNYWSDYTGSDFFSGEKQNILGSDGIGDTSHPINGGSNEDEYPLIAPYIPDYTVDYILIVNTLDTGESEITNQTVDVGFIMSGWAASFNDTVGYLGDISVNWSVSNAGSTATTIPSTGINSTFDSHRNGGSATWTADDGAGHTDTVIFTINPPQVDNILIVDTEGTGITEIPDDAVDVGYTIEGWAAAFNDTIGYFTDLNVTWYVNNVGSTTTTEPLFGKNSTFNADRNPGTAIWTADDGSGHSDCVNFTVNPPTINYIEIVDSQGTGANEILNQSGWIGYTIYGWAASFNNTIGYLGDIEVNWSIDNVGSNASTEPLLGTNSTFYSGWNPGTATWKADDGLGHADSVTITIDPAEVDYITIVDTQNFGTNEILDQSVPVGFTMQGWAAGFNVTLGYFTDVSVNWNVLNTGSVAYSNPSSGTGSIFNADVVGGSATWRADDGQGHNDSVIFTIDPPTLDYIQIRDAIDGEGNIVDDPTYPVGETTRLYAALFNTTAGFVSNAPSETEWESDDEDIVTATTPGIFSDITCHDENYGTVTITVNDGNGHTNVTNVLVLPPTVDEIKILDAQNGAGSEIFSPTYPVGATDIYYGAMFNDTAGYIGDVPNTATWSSNNARVTVTSPGSSTTITCSDDESGFTIITLNDGQGNQVSVNIEIIEPAMDYIQVQDESGSDGSPITDHTINLGESETYYAAGYNDTAGFIQAVEVTWSSSESDLGGLSSSQGSQNTFFAVTDKIGDTIISVSYSGNEIDSFIVSVVDTISPIADAGDDRTIHEGEEIELDGSSSEDNVEIASYDWTIERDQEVVFTADNEITSYEFSEPGTYVITLEVTDTSGNSDTDFLTVTVEEKKGESEQMNWLWLIILIIIIIVIVILLLIFLSGRRKKDESQVLSAPIESTPLEIDEDALPSVSQSTAAPLPPPPSNVVTRSRKIKCPKCARDFDVSIKEGLNQLTVTCPHCGTQGNINL
jgi:parallel beta-helix repeat protein